MRTGTALLKRATHRSKREIEELVAEIAPRPDAPAMMRKLPEQAHLTSPEAHDSVRTEFAARSWTKARRPVELRPDAVARAAPRPPLRRRAPVVQPLAPGRYKVQFTASAELRDKLERLRALMRSQVPDGDLAALIEQAVTEKLERLEARRFAKTKRAPERALGRPKIAPRRATSRPRSGAPCASATEIDAATWTSRADAAPSATGSSSTTGIPLASGATTARRTSRLMCRAHNAYLAEHDYGRRAMARNRQAVRRAPEATVVYAAADTITPARMTLAGT